MRGLWQQYLEVFLSRLSQAEGRSQLGLEARAVTVLWRWHASPSQEQMTKSRFGEVRWAKSCWLQNFLLVCSSLVQEGTDSRAAGSFIL